MLCPQLHLIYMYSCSTFFLSTHCSIPVNRLPCKSLISRMDWVSCAGDINLPHTPFPPTRYSPQQRFFLPILRVPPVNFQNLPPVKKIRSIKSWPTFCDQNFWKFPIWNSCADEKCQEIRMVKVNVIFNDIRLLICLTPLQVNWFRLIN